MKILVIKQDKFQSLEIEDMIRRINSKVFFVNSIIDAIHFVEKTKLISF